MRKGTSEFSKRNMLSIAKDLSLAAEHSVSLALETNGKGFHGFIAELPGAFVRGPSKEEAVSKAHPEARSYLRWLGEGRSKFPEVRIVQTHQCKLMVEDADCEILLDEDTLEMGEGEFRKLVELAKYSGRSFNDLFDSVRLKDWVDQARIRTTFYGQTKTTIREIFEHVKRNQYYYIFRTKVPFKVDGAEEFMRIRDLGLDALTSLFKRNGNSKRYTVDGEEWTLKKVLRRFIWHDRIHAKAIIRILEKQRQLGLVDSYEDPFKFNLRGPLSIRACNRPARRCE